MTPRLRLGLLIAVALAAGGRARVAHAQAWVGNAGGLDLSLDYNFSHSDKVVGDTPSSGGAQIEFPNGGSTTHQFTLGVEYNPIDKLAVNVSLPYQLLRYNGQLNLYPHLGGGAYDDGNTHGTFTDLRGGVRYQVLDGSIALAPSLGVSIPIADYETVGNTVAGRHLKALHLGAAVGYLIGESTYVHFAYEFSLVEKASHGVTKNPVDAANLEKHGQNHHDATLTVGHKLLDQRLDLHLDANGRVTDGGVSFSDIVPRSGTSPLSADEQLFHDLILNEDMLLVGGGAGYQLTDTVSLSLSARLFVKGINTQNASVVAFGVTWSPL